ncbi:pyridoxal phosphate-dependent aminotransferase [Pantoea sp. CCBC3-3-1]|uniref:pyridoxal phosphate-dependent aminotransferase n=1 Tax=Pantoea sp. CCBC3-3-1 TaxID=2490851 RepID=UPI00143D448A|nr:pyridoxal phosphate-dependent aminotransferase [Pantoea sp. CCBC3-3-1]
MKEDVSPCLNVFQQMTNLALEKGSVNLSQGIPENTFDDFWKAQITDSLNQTLQYTRTEGIHELRHAVNYSIYKECFDETVITSGCTESILCSLHAFKWMGYKNVICFEPFYSYYPGMAHMAGLSFNTVAMHMSSSFVRPDWDEVRRKVSSDSVLLINTPHNPTGYVFSDEDWKRLSSLQSTTACAVVLDDVYRDFNFTTITSPYRIFKNSRILIAGSVSKSFAATGARIGWLTGETKALSLAKKAHIHMSNCQPALLQNAAINIIRLLNGAPVEKNRRKYHARALKLTDAMRIAGFNVIKPDGGHFIMASHENIPGQGAFEKSLFLTSEIRVTPLPLQNFFSQYDGAWMRFSFAVTDEALDTACHRLVSLNL